MLNSKLKNMIELSSRMTIYIPSTVNINQEIDNTKHVEEAAAMLAGFFGGQLLQMRLAIGLVIPPA